MTGDLTGSPEYQEALQFLYSFVDYERNNRWKYDSSHFDLERVRDFFSGIGDPHHSCRFVHIAGTNGKGSVAAMTASAFRAAGYRTGLYTSPHLITFRERINIDGVLIPPEAVVDGVNRLRRVIGDFPGLTFFEVWTGLAFDYFARCGVDIAVIEVGMGGRLDTTNVITPEVSVITSVSMDHRRSLGNTVGKIAFEKAGIIKPGIPVVSAPQYPTVVKVIEEVACEQGSRFILAGRDVEFSTNEGMLGYRGPVWNLDAVRIPLPGAFQASNTAVALAALEQCAWRGFVLPTETVIRGVETVSWPGRLQTVRRNPAVIVDGACNIDAMREVCSFLRSQTSREKTIAVFGICQDKDIVQVLRMLSIAVSHIVFTQVSNPRAVSADELAQVAPVGVTVSVQPDPHAALEEAVLRAGEQGTVAVTGSLYVVGEIMKYLGFDAMPGMGGEPSASALTGV